MWVAERLSCITSATTRLKSKLMVRHLQTDSVAAPSNKILTCSLPRRPRVGPVVVLRNQQVLVLILCVRTAAGQEA
jgi:hypothetical protein